MQMIESEVPADRRAVLLESITALDESVFEGQNLDRMVAAIVILFLDGVGMDEILDEAQSDWRDLLVDAGLGGADWRVVMERRFGTSA
ncbi:hypothetical protein ACFW2D_25065 [Streptomyces sp. NPDC058914]|uniref:hypothetical protein n=1 Tax=Streptomyces sp. NPDC058914 TaxID=3346671 RepID=UPI00368A024E